MFDKNKHVTDPRVIDMLVIKVRLPLSLAEPDFKSLSLNKLYCFFWSWLVLVLFLTNSSKDVFLFVLSHP